MQNIEELIDLITLKKINETKFSGKNYKPPWNRVFGGQVLAQSLNAAYRTVQENRFVHSIHGYFILPGDIEVPIIYEVDNLRDGGSFSTRRVIAYQNNKAIFNMAASFQLNQKGLEHQMKVPNVKKPDKLMNVQEIKKEENIPSKLLNIINSVHPSIIEMRPVEDILNKLSDDSKANNDIWFKTKKKLSLKLPVKQQLLAYFSDYSLLLTGTFPHRSRINKSRVFTASLDHSIWFHRAFNIDDWLLYQIKSPIASNSRVFSRGNIFNNEGSLVASVAQEGLIRLDES